MMSSSSGETAFVLGDLTNIFALTSIDNENQRIYFSAKAAIIADKNEQLRSLKPNLDVIESSTVHICRITFDPYIELITRAKTEGEDHIDIKLSDYPFTIRNFICGVSEITIKYKLDTGYQISNLHVFTITT